MSPVSIDGPDGFVAAIPYLLGVHPHRSLIIAGLDSAGAVKRMLHLELSALDALEGTTPQVVAILAHHEPDRVLIAIIDDRVFAPASSHTHTDLADALTAEFGIRDIVVEGMIWAESTTPGSRFQTHTEHGVVADLRTSPLAVSRVTAGLVTYPDWESLGADFAPHDADSLRRRDELLHHTPRPSSSSAAHMSRAAITDAADNRLPIADTDLIDLAAALEHPCGLAVAIENTADRPAVVRELWVTLTRALPAPSRADAAALAALATYLTGACSVAVVGVLLNIAERANPEHDLAGLARQAIGIGTSPPDLTATLRDLARELAAFPQEN